MVGVLGQHFGFGELVFFFAEIRREAVAQVFGLADVQNPARVIYEFVDAGIGGDAGGEGLELFVGHGQSRRALVFGGQVFLEGGN